MVGQVDASPLFWFRTVADVAAALLRWATWLWRLPSRIVGAWRLSRAVRQAQIDRLKKKVDRLECEHRTLVALCERVIDQRDHNYHLYLQALRTHTAA